MDKDVTDVIDMEYVYRNPDLLIVTPDNKLVMTEKGLLILHLYTLSVNCEIWVFLQKR
ncbi:hypothetical protein LJC18_04310 [Lachnospiraceae bacterium OttesenSCG-928-E19]|nr:hypothetical protein [Lachnospiraceae bacterium OttesenSCG-928-E19]